MTTPDGEAPRAPDPASLSISLFGPFAARVDGVPLPRLRSRKGHRLLALLALRRGAEVERLWLAGTLWPDHPEPRAFASLRNSLKDLRHALGAAGARLYSPTHRTLALDLAGAAVDALTFDAAVARGDTDSLEAAVGLYAAPLLEGWTEEWVLPERQAREDAYVQALETLAAAASAGHEYAAAVRYRRRIVAVDPLREPAQRAWMEALAVAGDVAGAVAVYRDLRLLLHREVNAAPAPETVALYERLRAGVRGTASGRASRRVQPESVARPSREAAARSSARALPRPLSSFVGRARETDAVGALLATARLLTLTGVGGVGKTRLAIRVAEEVARGYPDGVGFVDLASLAEAALVPHTVARTLGLVESADRSPEQTLLDALRPRRMLVILDNCEHLRDGCASLVAKLLERCPELTVLATSRQSLGLPGETLWRVEPLALPETRKGSVAAGSGATAVERSHHLQADTDSYPLSALLQSDAVCLFMERAVAGVPHFSWTEANVRASVEVCCRLDGIPLAIELAAARLKALSVPELSRRLEDRFRLLTRGSQTVPPRRQTLAATLDWSYHLLTEPERALFRRLAVFAGGWTLDAAEAVCACGASVKCEVSSVKRDDISPESVGLNTQHSTLPLAEGDVLDLLTSLVDQSMVQYEERECQGRYRLLETVRQYGRGQLLQSGEETWVQARHLQHYLELGEQAAGHLLAPEQLTWLERIETENDNFRAALEWSLENTPQLALRLTASLGSFWRVHGNIQEGRNALKRALERAGTERHSSSGARSLHAEGTLAFVQGDSVAALALCRESLEAYRQLGDRQGTSLAMADVGLLSYHLADPAHARALMEEALVMAREMEFPIAVCHALDGLGHVAYNEGEFTAARAYLLEHLQVTRQMGDRMGIAVALTRLGELVLREGDRAAAREMQEESLQLWQALGDRRGMASALCELGKVATKQGEYAGARSYLDEALARYQELGMRPGIAITLCFLSDLTAQQGEYGSARRHREEALALWRSIGDRQAVMHSLGALGHITRKQGEFRQARAFYAESLRMRVDLADTNAIIASLEDFADLAIAEQQWARVTRLLGAVMSLREIHGKVALPRWHAHYQGILQQARAALVEDAFTEAWTTGQAMTLAEGVRAALEG